MKNKIVNVSLSMAFVLIALVYFLLKQNPASAVFFENINNPFVFPAYGIMQKIGWDLFSTLGIVFSVVLSVYFAFIFKNEKN